MEFAKKHLETLGWREGKGLGKEEDGIRQPIKPKLKLGNCGVGYDLSKELNENWWATTSGCNLKKNKAKNNGQQAGGKKTYDGFVQATSSCDDDRRELDCDHGQELKQLATDIDLYEIFENSKGLTCHRAARQGVKMSGKLERLKRQEEEFKRQRLGK